MLTEKEKNSDLWVKIKEEIEGRLRDFRTQIESDITEIKTAKLRGRIAELDWILSLGSQEKIVKEAAVD